MLAQRLALTLAFALHAAVSAAKVQVVEAVVPDWPPGERTDQKGTVVVEFVLAPGAQVFITRVDGGGLRAAFSDEARLAIGEWLITDDASGGCGLIHGRQEFRFDGSAAEPVALGATEASLSGDGAPIVSLDRVEIEGGRISRNQAHDPQALARHDAVRASYSQQRAARWAAAFAKAPRTSYVAAGVTSPVPRMRIEPQFPRAVLMDGRSGVVVSRLTVDERGEVTKVDVADSFPPGAFDQASRQALMRWQFAPEIDSSGKPQSAEVCQVFSYSIIDEGRFRQGGR